MNLKELVIFQTVLNIQLISDCSFFDCKSRRLYCNDRVLFVIRHIVGLDFWTVRHDSHGGAVELQSELKSW
ncbi:hypothetical protein AAFF_G00396060 [Aldrovandia affinis]|uniref:Uncharacterized protein n=1 Tax=Aldrovandia affinis TaxID=143900 RepID=A0AAD7WKQ7_9TELE|nr:hypothetical protein AAFF_G00396060 [Aldrovandia affinis]